MVIHIVMTMSSGGHLIHGTLFLSDFGIREYRNPPHCTELSNCIGTVMIIDLS